MSAEDTAEEPREDVSRLVVLAIIMALLALAALSWPVVRALRAPVPASDLAPDPAPVLPVDPVPLRQPDVVMEAPPAVEPAGSDFILDYETLQQREEVARDTVQRLREQAEDDPEGGLTEESIRQIEQTGDMIM